MKTLQILKKSQNIANFFSFGWGGKFGFIDKNKMQQNAMEINLTY